MRVRKKSDFFCLAVEGFPDSIAMTMRTFLLVVFTMLYHFPVSPFPMIRHHSHQQGAPPPLFQSTSSETPPIAKEVFVNAVRILNDEISRQTGVSIPALGNNENYIIGKLSVTLSITGNPGLDLTESGGLVLVTTVEGNALESGIRTKDTIIRVSVPGRYQQDCAACNLDDMSRYMETAVQYAIQAETGSIDLVLNRLLPIEYLDETTQ